MRNTTLIKIILLLLLTVPFSPPTGKIRCEDDGSTVLREKIVYLTFDDGPAEKVTNKILDILKAEGVPGTFFVIGNQIPSQEKTILRMKDEGHSIGLHSYSHNRDIIYRSNSDFVHEMKEVQNKLYEITGETYNILRFPFGCNNMTYNLTTSMVNTIHSNNFKIFDWTQDTLDGANPNLSPDSIVQHSISTKNNIVLLMHCGVINKNSALALPGVIKYYKNHGYKFEKITEETPEIYRITRKGA